MSKLKNVLAVFLFAAGCIVPANTQSIYDAIRYSTLDPQGTARAAGVGGALGAFGTEFTTLSTNPAGMAWYRRSELVISPTWSSVKVRSRLEEDAANVELKSEKTHFGLNAVGAVFVSRPLASDWKVTAFGIGLNRLANFNRRAFFEGTSPGSITDRWLELAQGLTPSELDDFEAGLAYEAEAIYNPTSETEYVSDFEPNEPVTKSQLIRQKGGINELVFSFAGNYDEKLMLGLTLGVPILEYEEVKTYKEEDPADNNPIFNSLAFTERLRTTGAGINLKLGMIYRINQMVRVGLAMHTPTGWNLDDSYSTQIDYSYTLNGINSQSKRSPEGSFEYRLRSPWRVIGSMGLLFDKMGFVSADIEWVDYTGAEFNFNKTNNVEDLEYEQELNDQIERQLGSAVNLRLGGEFAWEILRLRAGYALMASPFADDGDYSSTYSLGAGVRDKKFFFDIAFRFSNSDSVYEPYFTSNAPRQLVRQREFASQLMLTFGLKF